MINLLIQIRSEQASYGTKLLRVKKECNQNPNQTALFFGGMNNTNSKISLHDVKLSSLVCQTD